MMRFLAAVFCSTVFISCYWVPTREYSFDYEEKFETGTEAYIWVLNNIEYQGETGDEWQLPEETYRKKTGDCEDHAILLMAFLWDLGKTTRLCVVRVPGRGYHAIIEIGEEYWDSVMFNKTLITDYEWDVVYRYSYAAALHEAEKS